MNFFSQNINHVFVLLPTPNDCNINVLYPSRVFCLLTTKKIIRYVIKLSFWIYSFQFAFLFIEWLWTTWQWPHPIGTRITEWFEYENDMTRKLWPLHTLDLDTVNACYTALSLKSSKHQMRENLLEEWFSINLFVSGTCRMVTKGARGGPTPCYVSFPFKFST